MALSRPQPLTKSHREEVAIHRDSSGLLKADYSIHFYFAKSQT